MSLSILAWTRGRSMLISKKLYRSIELYLKKNLEKELVFRVEQANYGSSDFISAAIGYDQDKSTAESLKVSPQTTETVLNKTKKGRSDRSLQDIVSQPEESFSQMLFRLIREKDVDEVDTYKKAHIDRKLFSKIRSNDDYGPGKTTALSLALALNLSLDETLDLMGKAGFTLSHSNKSDLIIEYFIQEGVYDIFEINEALDAFGQPALRA